MEDNKVWKEQTNYYVYWSGKDVWGQYYDGNQDFDNDRAAIEFCEQLKNKDGMFNITLKRFTSWT